MTNKYISHADFISEHLILIQCRPFPSHFLRSFLTHYKSRHPPSPPTAPQTTVWTVEIKNINYL